MATEAVLTAVQMASQTSKLLRREEVAEGTMAFYFEKPSGFKFKAGQFVDVTLIEPTETDAEGNTRTSSIASPPFENELVFTTRMRDTAFKRSLKKVPLATEVKMGSAAGSFTLHKNRSKPAVFLAGGIGITPFLSILRQAHHDRLPHKLYLFYSNRRPEDAPFLDTLQNLEKTNPNFHLICTTTEMSKSQEGMEWRGSSDRPRDAVQEFDGAARPHLLQCRTARHGNWHERYACECGH
jgi:ferredoxin-NADP reductase